MRLGKLSKAQRNCLKLSGLLANVHESEGVASNTHGRRKHSLKKLLGQHLQLKNIQGAAVIRWKEENKGVSQLLVRPAVEILDRNRRFPVWGRWHMLAYTSTSGNWNVPIYYCYMQSFMMPRKNDHIFEWYWRQSSFFSLLPLIFKGTIYRNTLTCVPGCDKWHVIKQKSVILFQVLAQLAWTRAINLLSPRL